MAEQTNESAILSKDTYYALSVFDPVEGGKTGVLEMPLVKYLGVQVVGAVTFLKFSRKVGEGKKAVTELFSLNADRVLYVTDVEQPKPPKEEKKEEKKGEEEEEDDE